jgi:hypothetical protein
MDHGTYETDEEHGKSLKRAAPHQRETATEGIGKEEDEYEARNNLDNAVDTLSKETCGGV